MSAAQSENTQMPGPNGIVTRFAPSPTGYLHIGGARTALFNWLFAKANQGVMMLRIEDTDRARHSQAAVDAILDGLNWLGLDWSGAPLSQFSRRARHQEIALHLLEAGKAYRCFASAAELEEMRARAQAEKKPPRYDGRWRDRDPADAPAGVEPVIRLKAPQTGTTLVEDAVQGAVRFANQEFDDLVILRSDGTPTYMLAVIVDDHDMGVSHVIRGDDHLTNAGRQQLIYDALGWRAPVMAHIPLIHGPDGAKLSKRHGALGIDAYRAMGFLPQAMRNYLARLGWSHGDDEIFDDRQMIEWFDLAGIGRAPARLDLKKLEHVNGQHMRLSDPATLMADYRAFLAIAEGGAAIREWLGEPQASARLSRAIPGLAARSKTLVEFNLMAGYLRARRPIIAEGKAARLLDAASRARLDSVAQALSGVAVWEHESLEMALKAYCADHDIKLGKIAGPLRAALTGSTVSPGIYEVMTDLGRDESLARIADQAGAPAAEAGAGTGDAAV